MRQVAKLAGVSPATVSLVLRNHSSISGKTRVRVLQAQHDLGYTINRAAQHFVRSTRRRPEGRKLEQLAFCLLGVTFDDVAYAPFLHGIVSESQTRHLQLFTQSLEISAQGTVTLSSAIRNGGVDGIIISGLITDSAISFLQPFNLPIVVLGNYHLRSNVARVELDMRQTGSTLAEDLVQRGHREIAFVVEQTNNAYEAECLEGVRACLACHGVKLPDSRVISTGQSYSPASDLVGPFLKLSPLPTAILTTDARVADECVAELRAHQIEVPRQVDIAALVVDANARRGVRYRRLNLGLERCGRLAVRRLAELVETPGVEPSTTTLAPVGWVQDCAPPSRSEA